MATANSSLTCSEHPTVGANTMFQLAREAKKPDGISTRLASKLPLGQGTRCRINDSSMIGALSERPHGISFVCTHTHKDLSRNDSVEQVPSFPIVNECHGKLTISAPWHSSWVKGSAQTAI